MPAKKPKKPSRSIRYLLFADRRFQKISLRKISERVKKAKPAARTRRSNSSARKRRSLIPTLAVNPPAVVLGVGVISILAAAALITARQPAGDIESLTAPTTMASAPSDVTPPAPDPEPQVTRTEAKGTVSARPTEKPRKETAAPAASFASRATSVSRENAPESRTPPAAPVSASPAPPPAAVPDTPVRAEPAVSPDESTQTTITGCLVSDDDTFRLKDTSGVDAPKSRSWKSGFLRKRPATITIVDVSRALNLDDHVGQRVAVTGTLADREMRPRSLRTLAASCD